MTLTLFYTGDCGQTTRAQNVFGRAEIVRRNVDFRLNWQKILDFTCKNPLYFGLLEKLTNAILKNIQAITVANTCLSCLRTKYAVSSEFFFE